MDDDIDSSDQDPASGPLAASNRRAVCVSERGAFVAGANGQRTLARASAKRSVLPAPPSAAANARPAANVAP